MLEKLQKQHKFPHTPHPPPPMLASHITGRHVSKARDEHRCRVNETADVLLPTGSFANVRLLRCGPGSHTAFSLFFFKTFLFVMPSPPSKAKGASIVCTRARTGNLPSPRERGCVTGRLGTISPEVETGSRRPLCRASGSGSRGQGAGQHPCAPAT